MSEAEILLQGLSRAHICYSFCPEVSLRNRGRSPLSLPHRGAPGRARDPNDTDTPKQDCLDSPKPRAGQGKLLAVHAHVHTTHTRTHTHTSARLVWVLGASSPVIKSQGGTNIYFREETVVAVRTDSGWTKNTNHTVDTPSTKQPPQCRRPGAQAGGRSRRPVPLSGVHGRLRTRKGHAGD